MRCCDLAICVLFATSTLPAQRGDWPDFRGPLGQGHADVSNVPLEWSESRNVVWKVPVPGAGWSNVPRPVFGNGLVYIATGFQQPALLAVRPDGTGDVTRTHVAWKLTRGAPHTPSPLLVDGLLYIVNDAGILTCVDADTGVVRWQQRLNGTFSASPVFAAGRIYFLSEEGVTTVIAPGPEFRRLATNTLDGATLASMAVVDGASFIRSSTHLYRIGESAAQ